MRPAVWTTAVLAPVLRKSARRSMRFYSDDGVIILMDMGSAVMTTEMVLEMMEDRKVKMVDCPVVEGAVAAAVVAAGGAPMEDVIQVAEAAKTTAKF